MKEILVTKLEEYTAKAAESLAAHAAATNERDRTHHHRAHAIWRRLIANIGDAERRASMGPEPKAKPLKQAAERPFARN